jgi:hypothetical protein
MKFVSSIIFAASVASTLAAERGLQTLAKKWNITDPSFAYEKLGFTLDYQVSDFISDDMTAYALYTSPGCKENGTAVSGSDLTSNKAGLTGQDYNANNNGDGVRDQKLTVAVVADNIAAASGIYEEDNTPGAVTATVDFCVRFSLQTTTGDDAVEVNFLETLVTLFVDLSDGFEIGDVSVTPKEKLINTANQVYLLEGYQCNSGNVALAGDDLTATRNQGSVIRVCVKPDSDATSAGIFMRSLDAFTFSRGDITQPAIVGYNEASPNGLTSLTCSNGVDVCFFETILFAAFYNTDGVVAGSGTGSMQFGAAGANTRRLRALQADSPEAAATSEFELDFGVLNPGRVDPRDGSGAASAAKSAVMAASALVIAGAFALI